MYSREIDLLPGFIEFLISLSVLRTPVSFVTSLYPAPNIFQFLTPLEKPIETPLFPVGTLKCSFALFL